jgi:hypothetical protein
MPAKKAKAKKAKARAKKPTKRAVKKPAAPKPKAAPEEEACRRGGARLKYPDCPQTTRSFIGVRQPFGRRIQELLPRPYRDTDRCRRIALHTVDYAEGAPAPL